MHDLVHVNENEVNRQKFLTQLVIVRYILEKQEKVCMDGFVAAGRG